MWEVFSGTNVTDTKNNDLPSVRFVKEIRSTQGSCVHKHCIHSNSVSIDVRYKQMSD